MRKGKGAKLVFMGHALMENRNGMLMDFVVSSATGTAERDAVPVMLDDAWHRGFRPRTLAGDKGYDTRQCVKDMRDRGVDAACGSASSHGDRWAYDTPFRLWG